MKIFNTAWRKYQRILAAMALLACVAGLIALKPIDDKRQEMVVLGTRFGEMTILLYDETPQHKANFLKLVEEDFYDGLLFHRVISGFMVQGGDPDSRNAPANKQLGVGGPGYTIPAEILPAFIHKKGALAAARQGDQVNPKKESSGSQFYIVQGVPVDESRLQKRSNGAEPYSEAQIEAYKTLGGTPHLDGAYTVFGEVVDGFAVIDSIAAQQVNRASRPIDDIPMTLKIVKKKWR